MALTKIRACSAWSSQVCSPVRAASMLNRAMQSMLCSVDLKSSGLLPLSTPKLKPPAPRVSKVLLTIQCPSRTAPSRKRGSRVWLKSCASPMPVQAMSPTAEPRKKKRKKRWPQKDAIRVRLVNEIGLSHSTIAPGVCLLRMQQRFTQQHGARDIIATLAQQMRLQHQRIVVNKPGALQSLLVGVTL